MESIQVSVLKDLSGEGPILKVLGSERFGFINVLGCSRGSCGSGKNEKH
jgi:hypothetical protein